MQSSLKNEIRHLFLKEVRMEWRQRFAINGLLLYIISTIFVCYLSFKRVIDPPVWNSLFWIILLFGAVNAIAKSFIQDSRGQNLYMYSIASPQAIILSKTLYNILLMLALSMINLFFYSLLIGNIVQDQLYFILTLLLGSIGLATCLTMISAIASKANGSGSLMAILSFPVLIPLLLTAIKCSKNAIDGLDRSLSTPLLIILAALIVMIVTLSYILFPFLWKD